MPNAATESLNFEFPELDGKARLRELILYISQKCCDDPTFSATKLNKILFYADFYSYFRHGTPVTGVEYMKLPNGPAPRPLVPIRDQMEKDKDIAIQKKAYFKYVQHRICPLRDPDTTAFSAPDILMVDEAIDMLRGKSSKEVSEESHGRAWRIAKDEESIPYEAIFLSDDDGLTDNEMAHLKALNQEYGWE